MIPKEGIFDKLEPLVLPAIVVLVAVGAFGLGRLSAGPQHQALRILYPGARAADPVGAGVSVGSPQASLPAAAADSTAGAGKGTPAVLAGKYVASKTGSKYYLDSCSGVSRIKQDNRVYLASADEAKAAGYGPAANCPGI